MKNNSFFILSLLLVIHLNAFAQNNKDSSEYIQPVEINAYFSSQSLLSLTSSAKVISSSTLREQIPGDYLSAMNTVPGLRMEERSPGSYRLSIRGSMIRSPFGVRNIKIFMDDFPLTDAGGNTYLNLFDPEGTHAIHVIKGPDGSIYGPNSGGVIRFIPNGLQPNMQDRTSVQLSAGSYGKVYQNIGIERKVNDNYQFSLDQSFTRSDGYRVNSALNKKTIQTAHRWAYHPKGSLKAFAAYTYLNYQTPGGLTPEQYAENPKGARPAAGPNPGAYEQKAGIINKSTFAGISNSYMFHPKLSHHISVYGSYTDFENPFITNYEYRKEKNIGARTYLSYTPFNDGALRWKIHLGLESIYGHYDIKNYDNEGGVSKDPQAFDVLSNTQNTYFLKNEWAFSDRFYVDASLGWNTQGVSFRENYPDLTEKENIHIPNSWMPRIGFTYEQNKNTAWRASVSKGFSPPTLAEIRGSDNVINTDLKPEEGINMEIGWRWQAHNRRLITDISAYTYKMENGIVKQLNEIGADFYRNAGVIEQKGVEVAILAHLIEPSKNRVLNRLILDANLTYQQYRFGDYKVGNDDFSGNKVTAVPDYIFAVGVSSSFFQRLGIHIRYNHTGKLPLDDENAHFADSYHLLQAKAEYGFNIHHYKLSVFMGGDNLLNQKYSLGNDINAFGNRFYNAAPPANGYGGVKLEW